MGSDGRQKLLLKLADLWDEHAEELAELESFNNGTPHSQQKECVAGLAQEIRYHGKIKLFFFSPHFFSWLGNKMF